MKEEKNDSYNHILKYTGIFGGVQGLNILIALVRNKIVAWLLGPAGMGLASLFNSSVNFISQATNLGISFSAVRHVSELFDAGDEERIRHFIMVVRGWSLLTALLGMLVCILLGPFLSESTFSWGDHTLHFLLLSPAVGLMAITGGEMAILKGARQLKSLAVIQLLTMLMALIVSVPLYYFFGERAIVPAIVLMALSAMLVALRYSYRLYPLQLRGTKGILGEGREMVRLGVAFVLAGILGSGAEIVIRSYLNFTGDLDTVGFYNAGFMLAVTYAGMVFSAMETDYFPRLSAVGDSREAMCDMVNKQIEVSVLISSPMLALLIVFMPIIIPLLFTEDFVPVVPMAQVALLSMYMKAISLPIAYLTLAKGHSLAYFVLEAVFDIVMVALIVFGHRLWGLYGTGVALFLAYSFDVVLVYAYARVRYGYSFSAPVIQLIAIQLPIGVAVYLTTLITPVWMSWGMGLLLCFVCFGVSFYILRQKSSLWNALEKKFKSKLRRHA